MHIIVIQPVQAVVAISELFDGTKYGLDCEHFNVDLGISIAGNKNEYLGS